LTVVNILTRKIHALGAVGSRSRVRVLIAQDEPDLGTCITTAAAILLLTTFFTRVHWYHPNDEDADYLFAIRLDASVSDWITAR